MIALKRTISSTESKSIKKQRKQIKRKNKNHNHNIVGKVIHSRHKLRKRTRNQHNNLTLLLMETLLACHP